MDGLQAPKAIHHDHNSTLKTHKLFFFTQILFRLISTAATVAATWILLTSKQTVDVFGILIDARYSYSPAFKFFAYANLVVAAFTAVSSFVLFIIGLKSFGAKKYFFLFFLDLIMTTLLMAACSAATTFGYIGQHGNDHTGWVGICDHFHKFCARVTISVALSYLGLILHLILTIMSANSSRYTG